MATAAKKDDGGLPTGLDVEAFLAWVKDKPGRYELHDGEVIAMPPQRNWHATTKGSVYVARREAIKSAGVPCHAMPDGVAVHVGAQGWYEPDALVCCGPEAPGDEIKIDNPLIVVEVPSPSTGHLDESHKLVGYFSVASVQHYVIVSPATKYLVHHKRQDDGTILTRIVTAGPLLLDPPGLTVDLTEILS